jgi:hypothetical protein
MTECLQIRFKLNKPNLVVTIASFNTSSYEAKPILNQEDTIIKSQV